MDRLKGYVRLARLELYKVIFPVKEQVRNSFIAVGVFVFIVALILTLIDLVMSFSISLVIT